MITFPPRRALRFLPAILAVALTTAISHVSAEVAIKTGEKLSFLGDSITAQGWGNQAGYAKLVIAGLTANGITVEAAPAGIGGHKSNDMLARLERDVLSKKPQWMTLSCGVNDVWHGKNGVPLDDAQAAADTYTQRNASEPPKGTYKSNITAIVDRAQAAGIKVMILTATVIKEDLNNDENKRLAPYNDFLRQLAKEKHLALADLNAIFQEKLKTQGQPGKNVFTGDGVHMNTEGNKIMATGVLKAFGLDDAQLKKAQEAWVPLEAQALESAKRDAEAKAAKAAAEKAAKAAAAPTTPAAATPAATAPKK